MLYNIGLPSDLLNHCTVTVLTAIPRSGAGCWFNKFGNEVIATVLAMDSYSLLLALLCIVKGEELGKEYEVAVGPGTTVTFQTYATNKVTE